DRGGEPGREGRDGIARPGTQDPALEPGSRTLRPGVPGERDQPDARAIGQRARQRLDGALAAAPGDRRVRAGRRDESDLHQATLAGRTNATAVMTSCAAVPSAAEPRPNRSRPRVVESGRKETIATCPAISVATAAGCHRFQERAL